MIIPVGNIKVAFPKVFETQSDILFVTNRWTQSTEYVQKVSLWLAYYTLAPAVRVGFFRKIHFFWANLGLVSPFLPDTNRFLLPDGVKGFFTLDQFHSPVIDYL